jgi:hypothetical protein
LALGITFLYGIKKEKSSQAYSLITQISSCGFSLDRNSQLDVLYQIYFLNPKKIYSRMQQNLSKVTANEGNDKIKREQKATNKVGSLVEKT